MSDYDFDPSDILGGIFKKTPAERAQDSMKRASERIKKDEQAAKTPPAALRLSVRRIDGSAYLPAAEVAALLEANGITGTARKLRDLDRKATS